MTEPDKFLTNTLAIFNASTGLPTTGTFGGTGTKIILSTGTNIATPYALGINTNTLWYGVPSGASHVFYGGNSGTQELLRVNQDGRLTISTPSTGLPTTGTFGGLGTEIILSTGTSGRTPYALGINTNTMWYGVPSGASHVFYGGNSGTQELLRVGPTFATAPLLKNSNPYLLLSGNSANTIINANARVPFNTIVTDTWGGTYSTTNNEYTVPLTGLYLIQFTAYVNSATAKTRFYVYVNGSSRFFHICTAVPSTLDTEFITSGSITIQLNVNDKVYISPHQQVIIYFANNNPYHTILNITMIG
jgi:hypothetical protein